MANYPNYLERLSRFLAIRRREILAILVLIAIFAFFVTTKPLFWTSTIGLSYLLLIMLGVALGVDGSIAQGPEDHAANDDIFDKPHQDKGMNPATGQPMVSDALDAGGNMYGSDH